MKRKTGIKGEYRDVIVKKGKLVRDSGWKSNTIVPDYGRFLAALMKKEFNEQSIGIEYLAVGNWGTGNDPAAFRDLLCNYFKWLNAPDHIENGKFLPYVETDRWVWAKPVEDMEYLNEDDVEVLEEITNKLKIEVIIKEDEPSQETFDFKEFALLGITKNGTFNTNHLFLINYVCHGQITKDNTMALTRTIRLTFPINTNEEENNG